MAGEQQTSALRRKLAPRPPQAAEPQGILPGGSLARTLSRAISDNLPLVIEDSDLSRGGGLLVECLDTLAADDFIGLIQGAGDGFGLITLDQAGFSALVEAMTMGRIAARAPTPRRPTATDAALVAAVIDAAFDALDPCDPLRRARFDRHVPDQRLLPILMEDGDYQRVTLRLTLVSGLVQRPLAMMLYLRHPPPARAVPMAEVVGDSDDAPVTDRWGLQIKDRIMSAPAALGAELGRVRRPLSSVLSLKPGDTIDLPLSVLEEVQLIDMEGQRVALGRLGQSRGMRAIRVTTWPDGPPLQPPHESLEVAPGPAVDIAMPEGFDMIPD